ncbi:MAG TPA: hypothetical protein VHE83_19600 [Mycobacteriales bacterium]|nr:hypothetical protein [Mycobacteriales bacterium]
MINTLPLPQPLCIVAVAARHDRTCWEAALLVGDMEAFRTRAGIDHAVDVSPGEAVACLRALYVNTLQRALTAEAARIVRATIAMAPPAQAASA